MKFVIIAIIFVAAVATLITVGIVQSGIPVFALNSLLSTNSGYQPGETIKVQRGRIVEIVSQDTDLLKFRYGDLEHPTDAILVTSTSVAPDNFRVGVGATLTGTYDPEARVFRASQVATNCPTKYEENDAGKQQGYGGSKTGYSSDGAGSDELPEGPASILENARSKPGEKAPVSSGTAP